MDLKQQILLLDRPNLVPKYRSRLERCADSFSDADLQVLIERLNTVSQFEIEQNEQARFEHDPVQPWEEVYNEEKKISFELYIDDLLQVESSESDELPKVFKALTNFLGTQLLSVSQSAVRSVQQTIQTGIDIQNEQKQAQKILEIEQSIRKAARIKLREEKLQ